MKSAEILPWALEISQTDVGLEEDLSEIRNKALHYPLVIVRNQQLDKGQFQAFMNKMGFPLRQKFQNAHVVEMSGKNQRQLSSTSELGWHADESYCIEYPEALCLYAITIPDESGKTHWANSNLAYLSLDQKMRHDLQKMESIHAFEKFDEYLENLVEFESAEKKKLSYAYGKCVQPVVKKWRGRPFLCLNHGFTTKILGAPEQLLPFLLNTITKAENTYSHRWARGDLLISNNHLLIHRRDAFTDPKRLLYRGLMNFEPAPKP